MDIQKMQNLKGELQEKADISDLAHYKIVALATMIECLSYRSKESEIDEKVFYGIRELLTEQAETVKSLSEYLEDLAYQTESKGVGHEHN